MLPFALTIFTGAFLLFQVQPLIGKYILPWFGGGPGVWTTCLLFFQMLLLAGYAYAHFSTSRLSPRRQVILHLALLAVALALLPITPSDSWRVRTDGDPNVQILLLLAASIGVPYFVLSSTGSTRSPTSARCSPCSAIPPSSRSGSRGRRRRRCGPGASSGSCSAARCVPG
jgi:hypothetical protein